MGFHHVAIAVKNLAATHRFYTEAMGFELVKTHVSATPTGGRSKHVFYDTGDGPNAMIAFWELDDPAIGSAWPAGLSVGLGLPDWVNHLAFDAKSVEGIAAKRDRWLANGIEAVVELDHDFCISIYAHDPDGTLVEWCTTVRDFTTDERAEALALLHNGDAPLDERAPGFTVHRAPATQSA